MLVLEGIGDNIPAQARKNRCGYTKLYDRSARRVIYCTVGKTWVARLIGIAPNGYFEREFLRPKKDYKGANGTGSRGVLLSYELYDGAVYEVNELLSWNREDRYFVRAVKGAIERLSALEARNTVRGVAP